MRKAGTNASLSELMGQDADDKGSSSWSLEDLPELLGEKRPDMPFNRVGKYRLMQSLRIRFGAGYRNIPGVQKIMKEFDGKVADQNVIRANKGARNGKFD